MLSGILSLALLFLMGAAMIAGLTTALLELGRLRAKEEFKKYPTLFFFQHLMEPFFGKRMWEGLFFTLSLTKHVLHLSYGVITIFLLLSQKPFFHAWSKLETNTYSFDNLWMLGLGTTVIVVSLVADMFLKLVATASPQLAFKLFSPFASLFLTLFSPLTALFLKIFQTLFSEDSRKKEASSSLRNKILEILYEADVSSHLDPEERKLIISVASFKERNAREVMVPRINIFSMPVEITLHEAAHTFFKEGYSRIPVYEESVDRVIGVLLYKDVLAEYAKHQHLWQTSIKSLIKPVLYTPETKKIASLLQEFRSKQVHLAIVVDEYGGTEGIVTIEDILEELVGEIGDEHDTVPEVLYSTLPSGGWIIDARMSILDIEKELRIQIPQSTEYDTLGGYIFHRSGSIPAKGWRLHHDDFDLEILSSDDRSIEKIRITPHTKEE